MDAYKSYKYSDQRKYKISVNVVSSHSCNLLLSIFVICRHFMNILSPLLEGNCFETREMIIKPLCHSIYKKMV